MIAFGGVAFTHFVVAADQADHARFVRQRWSEVRAAGPVERHQRTVQRRGDVHQAGIVADYRFTGGDQNNGLLKLGFAGQIAAPCLLFGRERGEDFIARFVVFRGAKQYDLKAFVDQLFRQLGVVIVRPAFCRAELCAGAEADNRALG